MGLSEKKRNIELAKCQVLCYDCHLEKSKVDITDLDYESISGENNINNKYSEERIEEIIALRSQGIRTNTIARMLNVNRHLVGDVINGRSWKHVTGIT